MSILCYMLLCNSEPQALIHFFAHPQISTTYEHINISFLLIENRRLLASQQCNNMQTKKCSEKKSGDWKRQKGRWHEYNQISLIKTQHKHSHITFNSTLLCSHWIGCRCHSQHPSTIQNTETVFLTHFVGHLIRFDAVGIPMNTCSSKWAWAFKAKRHEKSMREI